MSLNKNLWLLAVLALTTSLLYGQEVRTVAPPSVVRYVAPLFGTSANPCLPMKVVVAATIGAAGEVSAVDVISGPMGLHKPVTEAVRLWLFEPTLIDGKPTPVRTEVEVSNTSPDAKCKLQTPSSFFSFDFGGVQGRTVSLGGASYGCEGCWFIRSEGAVAGGPLNGGPAMLFRLRSETNELEFKCRAHECKVENTRPSTVPGFSQTLRFDETGVIPTSARVTFTVIK